MDNYKALKTLIESTLDDYLHPKHPQILWEAMRYTTLAGGKRIRAILCLESARMVGGDIYNALPTACALEMLHAQSLIHDDLPCMDDDDFRRGKPSNHKKYGEAIAVLAGDALLSQAPLTILQKTPKAVKQENILKVLEEFLTVAGASALVGGQVADMISENNEIKEDFSECYEANLFYIHTHKTGELIRFSTRAGAILSGATENQLKALDEYGKLVGFAFQVADDIIDITGTEKELGKTPKKDLKAKKLSYPALHGLKESRIEVEKLCKQAKNVLMQEKLESDTLIQLADELKRKATE